MAEAAYAVAASVLEVILRVSMVHRDPDNRALRPRCSNRQIRRSSLPQTTQNLSSAQKETWRVVR